MTWPDTENFRLQPDQTLVFTGDSITHWYGGPERVDHPLGLGYCARVGQMLTRIYGSYNLAVHNRGISGNKIADLLARLQTDVLDLQPDWVSLLIGINDTASTTNPGTPTADFARDYQAVVDQITGSARLVVMTPFFVQVPGGATKIQTDLDEKIAVVQAIGAAAADVVIPLHEHVASLTAGIDPALFAPDGVHPSQLGHGYIADLWRAAMGAQQP